MNFVILCGGSGSRLWPKSREKLPKQLLQLTNLFSMLQNTLLRVKYTIDHFTQIENMRIFIICNKEHAHIIETQISEINLSNIPISIISEPKGRDSGPAVCISALLGKPEDITCIIPSDHIFNDDAFAKCYIDSLEYTKNSIITFGIKPSRIETGYGYIQFNKKTFLTEKFVEKPEYQTAKTYVSSGNYLWNAGVFIFKNANMIQCFSTYAPDILEGCRETMSKSNVNTPSFLLDADSFINIRAISVDYAIMEHLCKDSASSIGRITIPYNWYWNDIGSYSALYDEMDKNENNNVELGDCISINTKNCYIDSQTALVATVGVENLVIVQTDDAILVCNKDTTQDVKKVVDKLKQDKREEAVLHTKVFRPWGWYINVYGNDYSEYKMKLITVYPGKRLSLQSHNFRCEHWVIVSGLANVQCGDSTTVMRGGEHVYIPCKTIHRIENIGESLLEFTETQIGGYLGEDDIIRYEDDFGRV